MAAGVALGESQLQRIIRDLHGTLPLSVREAACGCSRQSLWDNECVRACVNVTGGDHHCLLPESEKERRIVEVK